MFQEKYKICPFCKETIPNKSKKCPICAEEINFITCEFCKEENLLGSRSCKSCGQEISLRYKYKIFTILNNYWNNHLKHIFLVIIYCMFAFR